MLLALLTAVAVNLASDISDIHESSVAGYVRQGWKETYSCRRKIMVARLVRCRGFEVRGG